MSRKNITPAAPSRADGPLRLHSDDAASPHVAKLVKALPEEEALSEFQLARVQRNVLASSRPRRRRLYFGVRAMAVATLLIVGATVGAAAAMVSVRWFRNSVPHVQPAPHQTARASHVKAKRVAARLDTQAAPAVAVAPTPPLAAPAPFVKPHPRLPDVVVAHEPDVAPRGTSRFATSLRPSASPGLAPPDTVTSAVEEQAAAMSGALRLLRAGDRAAAIEQLRLYVQRFPRGAFAEEAQVALVSALVENGAHAEAEAALIKVTGSASASPALRLLRAELGFASVCAAPLRLFEEVLATAPALRERALYGAAMANARCGDRSRGQKLMNDFLQAFPHSPSTRSIVEHLRSSDLR